MVRSDLGVGSFDSRGFSSGVGHYHPCLLFMGSRERGVHSIGTPTGRGEETPGTPSTGTTVELIGGVRVDG